MKRTHLRLTLHSQSLQRSRMSRLAQLYVWALVVFYAASPVHSFGRMEYHHQLTKRSMSSKHSMLDGKTFDYVIAGGGQAGAALAGRLSENPNVTVAVIEAGVSGTSPDDSARLDIPSANLYNSSSSTYMDWQFTTEKQVYLDGKTRSWPRGKVVGGSSAINGLYYVRHSKEEQNAWAKLIGDESNWGWDKMYHAMKKSEHFVHPLDQPREVAHIYWDPSSHGKYGPVGITWPAISYPQVGAFVDTSSKVASPYNSDPNNGKSWGTFVAALTINSTDWTRSFARAAYIDPVVSRPNLKVLAEHRVSRIMFDTSNKDSVKATGVKFKKTRHGKEYTVHAKREVIVASGTVNTPQILQLSGIGEKNLLKSKNINVVVNLPGVGEHLQDHMSTGVVWSPKNSSLMPPQIVTGNAKVDSFTNSGTAYVNASTVMGNKWPQYIKEVKRNKTAAVNALQAPWEVKKGYEATYDAVTKLLNSPIGAVELLLSLTFGNVQVQAAMQHPMSRGKIYLNSADVFDAPVINPRYMEQRSDMDIMFAGAKLAQKVGQTDPLNSYMGSQVNPSVNTTTREQWIGWLRNQLHTEFHPCGTASMMPRNLGGVVNNELLVYGTSNLRVVDASVIPILPSAHLMSVVYGIAEIAADIIKSEYSKSKKSANVRTQSSSNQSNSDKTGIATSSDSRKSNGGSQMTTSSTGNGSDHTKGAVSGTGSSNNSSKNDDYDDNAKGSSQVGATQHRSGAAPDRQIPTIAVLLPAAIIALNSFI